MSEVIEATQVATIPTASAQPMVPVSQPHPASRTELVVMAIERGITDVGTLERLINLQRQMAEDNARREAAADLAAMKASNKFVVPKDKLVKFADNNGKIVEYRHSTLGAMVDHCQSIMGAHGFSHHWDVAQMEGGIIQVTCVLKHKSGHLHSVTMRSGKDDSGKKNAIQQVASAVSYLERYTFAAVVGIASSEGDDDGRSAEVEEAPQARGGGEEPGQRFSLADLPAPEGLTPEELDARRTYVEEAETRANGTGSKSEWMTWWAQLGKDGRRIVGMGAFRRAEAWYK